MSKSNLDDKPLRYRSKYSSIVKLERSANKLSTLRFTNTPVNSPQEYLRKHSKERRLDKLFNSEKHKSIACLCRIRNLKETPSPKEREASPILMEPARSSFIDENSIEDNKCPSSTQEKRIIETKDQDIFDLGHSGLTSQCRYKQNLRKRISHMKANPPNLRDSRNEFLKFLTLEDMNDSPKRLSLEIKEEILEDLVHNLKELLKKYLAIPLKCDTPQQISHKKKIDHRMDLLQRDIDMIQRNKDIFIGKDKLSSSYSSNYK